ncbi:unnamed protein product [Rhizophagus irregularis]|nr:unnamed protein product [Rhizophagus irregularis]
MKIVYRSKISQHVRSSFYYALLDRNIWNICEISKKRPLNFANIKECERLRGSPITSIFSDSILEMDNSHLR